MLLNTARAVWRERSGNVMSQYAYFICAFVADSLLVGPFFVQYTSNLPDYDAEVAGNIQMAGGAAAALAAVPLAYWADRASIVVVMRWGAVVAALWAMCTGAAILTERVALFYAGSVASTVKLALITAPQLSLIARSVHPAHRMPVLIFITSVLQALASAVGPAAALVVDARTPGGLDASEGTVKWVLIAAAVVGLATVPWLLTVSEAWYWPGDPAVKKAAAVAGLRNRTSLNDDAVRLLAGAGPDAEDADDCSRSVPGYELGAASCDAFAAAAAAVANSKFSSVAAAAAVDRDAGVAAAAEEGEKHLSLTTAAAAAVAQGQLYRPARAFGIIPLVPDAIPWLIFFNDFAEGFAGGLTEAFFLSMLHSVYGQPATTGLVVLLCSSFVTAGLAAASLWCSFHLGRAATVVLSDAISLACMVTLALRPPLWAAIVAYLLSYVSAASYGVQRGILYDVVPVRRFTLWGALENVSVFLAACGTMWAGHNLSPKGAGEPGGFMLNARIAVGFNMVSLLLSLAVLPMAHDRHIAPQLHEH